MPILDVEIVVPPGEVLDPGLARVLADRAGEVLGMPSGRTWVRLRTLPRDRYAENGGGPPAGVCPVFVTVLKARFPTPEELPDEVSRLTTAVAKACQRPGANVHVLYLPEARGRIAFGGNLVPR